MRINSIQHTYNIQNNIPSFKARNPLSMPFMRTLKNVTCVYCGQEMLTTTQIEDFARKASKLTGKRLAKFLSSYETKMKPNEIYTTRLIKETLKKNPHADLKKALEIMFPYHIKKLEIQQKKVLDKVSVIAQAFSEHDKKITLEQVELGYKGIADHSTREHFKRNQYINSLFGIKNQFEKSADHNKIMSIINEMPNTHTSSDALIIKYSRKSPFEIAFRLLIPNQSTIEHLNPKSCGGTNDLKNLVLACRKDNSDRSSKPIEQMTNLERYLPEYFRTFKKSLAKKLPVQDFKKIGEYVEDVKTTIKTLLKRDLHICDNSKCR